MSHSELIQYILEDRRRPKLPENLNTVLGELIKSCWAENPEERPDYPEILEKFSRIDFNE